MLNLIFDTHTRAKLVQYLIEKAEAIFLRAKYRHKDAAEAEMRGQESEAKAAELLDVAQRRGAEADDARTWEVRLRHSSGEADEQGRATGCGAGGAKGGGRGECEPAKHAPGTVPGKRVTGAGAHTARRENIAKRRYLPEVGAVCGKSARTDLYGGRPVMDVSTAIPVKLWLPGNPAVCYRPCRSRVHMGNVRSRGRSHGEGTGVVLFELRTYR